MPDQHSLRTKIAKEVFDQLIADMSRDKIALEKAREIARITLDKLDEIEKHEESVQEFYEDLSKRHEPFNILYTKVKSDVLRGQEDAAYRAALLAIHAGDVEAAQKVASGALNITANETTNT